MILCDSQTYFSIGLEPSIFVHENNIWRLEGVFIGQDNLSVINSFMELCVFRTKDCEMPVVQIVLKWCSEQMR